MTMPATTGRLSGLFERIEGDIYLLKTPFGLHWSGVVLVRGETPVLIDSGADAGVVDNVLLPALDALGLNPAAVRYLCCTHTHGDHVGGHARFLEHAPGCVAVAPAAWAHKLADPLRYGRVIRTRFPGHSPPVQSGLRGVDAGMRLEDGGRLAGRLRLLHTPGHDEDSVCWLDEATGFLIAGDSVQGAGAAGSGLAFYQDAAQYRGSLERLADLAPRGIVAAHDYAPGGAVARGREAAQAYLRESLAVTDRYARALRALRQDGDRTADALARELIRREGRGEPAYLFLEMHTVAAHCREMDAGEHE